MRKRAARTPWHYITRFWCGSDVADEAQGRRQCETEGGKRKAGGGRGAERRRKRLPSCSTSVSVKESRSAMTVGHEARAPLAAAARRSSSSFFSTSARKLHATWPRIVSSS